MCIIKIKIENSRNETDRIKTDVLTEQNQLNTENIQKIFIIRR